MCSAHVVWPGEKFPWMKAITEAQNSVCAKWPPAKHVWCLLWGFAVLRTARDCAEHAVCHEAESAVPGDVIAWGQHTFCPVSTTPTGLECGCTPILSMGILSCFCLHVASSSSETLCMKLIDKILLCLQQEKNIQSTFCWTYFENSLVCGLHVHQSQEVWVMHWCS